MIQCDWSSDVCSSDLCVISNEIKLQVDKTDGLFLINVRFIFAPFCSDTVFLRRLLFFLSTHQPLWAAEQCVPGAAGLLLGPAAAALHALATAPPEQRPATPADPGSQPTLRQSPQRGEPGPVRTAGNLHGRLR